MHNDFEESRESEYLKAPETSDGEIAARVWIKVLGKLPNDFYSAMDPEAKAAICKALEQELVRAHTEKAQSQALRDSSSKVDEGYVEHQDKASTSSQKGELRKDWSEIHLSVGETRGIGSSGANYAEKQQEGERAERAWNIVTEQEGFKRSWLKPEICAREKEELAKEAERVRKDDETHLSPEIRTHYLGSDSAFLKDAYERWVDYRVYLVSQKRGFKFSEFDSDHVDKVIEQWQRNIESLRLLAHLCEKPEAKERSEGASDKADDQKLSEDAVEKSNEFCTNMDDKADFRAQSDERIGPVADEFCIDDCAFNVDFDFKEGHHLTESGQPLETGRTGAESEINRLLLSEGIALDDINLPAGLDGRDDQGWAKEDNLECERKDWSDRER